MIEVAGEPFIRHQLRLLKDGGVDDALICIGEPGSAIEDEVTRHHPDGMTVRCSTAAGRYLGTGSALRRAATDGLTDEQFMVLHVGSYPLVDLADIWEWFDVTRHLGLMTVWHYDGRLETSNAAVRNGRVVVYRNAAIHSAHPSLTYIGGGLGVLTADAVLDLVPADQPDDLGVLYRTIATRGQLEAYEVNERFHDIGPESGRTAFDRLLASELQRWA